MASVYQVVDGRTVKAEFRREDGTYKPIDESDAYERAARNQYLRELRKERAAFVRKMREEAENVSDCGNVV